MTYVSNRTLLPVESDLAAESGRLPGETLADYDHQVGGDVTLTLAVNGQGFVTAASPSIVRELGSAPDAIIGERLESLIHPDDRPAFHQALGAPAHTAGACRVRRQDGTWYRFAISAATMLDQSGHNMTLVTLHPLSQPLPQLAEANIGDMPDDEHIVQFYATDEFLVDALTRFIQTGLDAGEACVVIATQTHRARLETRLQASGLNLTDKRRGGLYVTMDADKLLTSFMVEGVPDPDRFARAIGRMIQRAAKGGRRVRIFGEMVAQLWLAGNQTAALRLEALWNELQQSTIPAFALYCAYPMQIFAGDAQRSAFAAVCQEHTHVIPDETYSGLASLDERLRAISRLQQEAHSLKVEIARRQLVEEHLRLSELRYRSLFEASLDGILMIEPETERISEANPAAVELLGGMHDQIVGQELWQVGLFPDRETAREVVRMLRARPVLRYEALPLRPTIGEQRQVEFVGSQIAVNGVDGHVIIQCRLRDVSERKKLERAAAERASELEAIQTVTDVALAHTSLDMLLPELMERVRTVLVVDNVAILLPDAAGRDLTIHLARGPEEEVAGQVRVPIGQGVAGRIAATRQPLIIDDLRTVKVANPFLRERLRSLMGVPLLVEDRLIGVIHVATIRSHRFTDVEVRLLQLVADRIALAIERAQLHQVAQHAHREAIERANELHATIEAIADGVVVFDRDGRLLQMNATAQQLLGYDAQPVYAIATTQISQRQVRDARGRTLPPDEWPVRRVLQGEIITGAQTVDLIIQAAEGREIQVSVSGAPVRDDAGGVLGAVCVFRDVSEQRRLERRTHEALTALIAMAGTLVELPGEAQPDAVEPDKPLPHVPSASSPAASPVAHRLAQLARDVLGCQRVSIMAIESTTQVQVPIAVVGLSPDQERQWWEEQRAHPARHGDGVDPVLRARFEASETLMLDMTQPPYDVLPNPYDISTVLVAPLRVGTQLIGILALDFGGPPHRFTEQERALAGAVAQLAALVIEHDRLLRDREEARATALAAHETTRRIHAFLGIAGHELRTPVTSIKAGVQLSERALHALLEISLPAETTKSLQRAQTLLVRADQQANRLHRLIEDILDVTRTQAGRLSLHAEPGDLVTVVRQAVEAQQASWPSRTITFVLPETPVRLSLDADRIEQVVANFLTNALKYSAEDQAVSVHVTTTRQMARVAVLDHGPGLSQEMQMHLWEPFHQVDGIRQLSGSGVGLGLGLHICRTLIERHGGRVGVDSVVGEGSTFWFELPWVPSTAGAPDAAAMV